ncbi:hypothetical protein [Hyphomicrobium zavarzinii]|uniref:hypothetical protein n=1 Tax=Hyphomicrobium zavarzinii TaxID=48292 RepID=UPI0012EB48C4|nr:hypothetical protein [Hyphomicrobium zavarzinii]
MKGTTARIDVRGLMDSIPKSSLPLAPVFESITNALEAISERQKVSATVVPGLITVKLYFGGLLDETKDLERIEIGDNGIGFDADNFDRFETFLDRSKGYNNRGSGRVQYLHFADHIEVTSHYRLDGKTFKRHFDFSKAAHISTPTNEIADATAPLGSVVAMSGFAHTDKEKSYFDTLTMAELRNAIKSHFLLRLHLEKEKNSKAAPSIKIEFYKKGKCIDTTMLAPGDIPDPLKGAQIKVPHVKLRDPKADDLEWVPVPGTDEVLHWAHFKLPEDELVENGVVLCSKNVAVSRLRFDAIKKTETVDGHRFMTAFYGDVFDKQDNVSHSVDKFLFPSQRDVEKAARDDLFFDPARSFLFFDSIKDAIEGVIPGIYHEVFELKKTQEKDVEAIAKAHGISADVVRSTKIDLSDSEQQITEKLYRKQAESLARRNLKIKKLYDGLTSLDPTADNYHEDLERLSEELLQEIPQSNKEELSRYVIRRQMVTKVLRLILDEKLVTSTPAKKSKSGKKQRKDREGLIHDLLFKRKTSTGAGPNDLWVLNEEFVHFEGCSELAISQITDAAGKKLLRPITQAVLDKYGIKPRRRPDIFLFAEESQCVLIELKEPDVDLSDYLNQLPKYCNLIANFSVLPIERFYCYLIGENFSPIDIGGDYRRNVHGDWVRRSDLAIMSYEDGKQEVQIATGQIEIIKLSSIHARAVRRNKSFADKLGVSDSLGEP